MVMTVVMMVVMMIVHVLMLFFTVNSNTDVGTANAALHTGFSGHCYTGNPQRIQLPQKCIPIRQQFQQCRRQHITGCAHAAVDIKCPHFLTSMWLIILAR